MKKYLVFAFIVLAVPMSMYSNVTTSESECCTGCAGCVSPHGICECQDKSLCSDNCTCRSIDQDHTNNDN